MVPHRHPHIAIVLEMIERRLRAVEDCLQRHLTKETIDYANACSEKKSKIAINIILTLCVVLYARRRRVGGWKKTAARRYEICQKPFGDIMRNTSFFAGQFAKLKVKR